MSTNRLQLANLDFNSAAKIKNLPAASANGEPVRYEEFNAAIEGLAWKDSARVATQANLDLSAPGATIDGVSMSSGDRVLVRNQTTAAENGIYIWNGASSAATRAADASTAAELESAILTVEEGTDAGVSYRQSSVNFTLDSGDVAWAVFGTAVPSASESTAGKAEIATQGETDTGTDDARIVTPAKLAAWAGRKLKFTANFGDGAAQSFDFAHNFGTRAVKAEVFRNGTPWDTIDAAVSRPDTNTVRVETVSVPTSNEYTVLILG